MLKEGGDEGQLDRWSRCLEGLLLATPHRLLLPDARQLSCGARVGQVHICPAHLHQVCGEPKNSTSTPQSPHFYTPFPPVM